MEDCVAREDKMVVTKKKFLWSGKVERAADAEERRKESGEESLGLAD